MAALPSAPSLRVVGRDDLFRQGGQQMRDAARAMPQAPPPPNPNAPAAPSSPPVGLAGFVLDQYSLMRRHRDTVGRGWSDRLLAALRAFNGIYEQAVIEEIKKFGGSNVYSRLIAMKCRGTSSLLRDVYLGGERPWGIDPASDPDIPPEIRDAIGTLIGQEVQQAISAHLAAQQAQAAHEVGAQAAHSFGQAQGLDPGSVDQSIPSQQSGPSQGAAAGAIAPDAPAPPGVPGAGIPATGPIPPLPDPGSIRDRYNSLVEGARDQAKRKAAEQAKVAEDKLQELLAEGGFYIALAEFLVDVALFPYAVIKGPTVKIKTQVKWTRDQAPWSPAEMIPQNPGQPTLTPLNSGSQGQGALPAPLSPSGSSAQGASNGGMPALPPAANQNQPPSPSPGSPRKINPNKPSDRRKLPAHRWWTRPSSVGSGYPRSISIGPPASQRLRKPTSSSGAG